ncbi:hypothetical protein [Oribacterium sp. FC2011]|uniref:hypothetical protein n=1 Tax=Oribacterium sp. FC2011 TaxID=1408311 RepID=UPI0006796887|nr:hypothetical protein [Oribacterium sp. FC2011]
MKKSRVLIAATIGIVFSMVFSSLAGWQSANGSWKYLNDDGTYVTSSWYCIDDDNDGYGKWYRFDESGNMLVNTTIDNRKINSNGAWYLGDENNEMTGAVTRYTPIDTSISGIYTYQYNINDTGKWTRPFNFEYNSVILEYIDNNHLKVTRISDIRDGASGGFTQRPSTEVYSRVAGSEFGYISNTIMDGYMTSFKIDPSTNTFIFGGEEDGDSYYVKTDSVKPHEGIVGSYHEEVYDKDSDDSETFDVDLYDDNTYYAYHWFISKGRGCSGTYTLNGNKLIFSNGEYFNNEDIYIENGLIYFADRKVTAIYRGAPDYSNYPTY